MFESLRQNRVSQLLGTAAGIFRVSDWTLTRIDPDGLRYVVTVSVWVHWFVAAICLALLVYRPWYGPGTYAAYALLLLTLVVFNGYVHYRLASNRTVDLALDLRAVRPGHGPDHGVCRAGRGLQSLLLPPALLPGPGRVRGVLHLLPAQHGLRYGDRRRLPGDEPDRGGGDRPGSQGGEAPVRQDRCHVRGGGGGQPALPVRADPGGGRRWSGSGPCSGSGSSSPSPSTTPRPSPPT